MQEMSGTNICLQTACTCGKSMDQQDILLLVGLQDKDETAVLMLVKHLVGDLTLSICYTVMLEVRIPGQNCQNGTKL